MEMLRLAGFGVCAAMLAAILRRLRPEAGMAVSAGAGVLLALVLMPTLQSAVEGLSSIARSGGVPEGYLNQLLKVSGVSLLADFAAQTCRDAREEGLAMKVELAGRVVLVALSLPFMEALLTQILSLSP